MRALGLTCILAALVSGVLNGVWELQRPILSSPAAFAAAAPGQRWCYGVLQVLKAVGFVAGLVGFARVATRMGAVVRVFLVVGALGAAWFAGVWLYMAATGRHTIAYVAGGLWYQWIVPIALGIAAITAHRVSAVQGCWAVILGILNAVIFGPLGPAWAQIVQGVIWLPLGWFVLSGETPDRIA